LKQTEIVLINQKIKKLAHSKGPSKGKKSTTDSDELRKPAKLKPIKGKIPKKAKDISAFEEEEEDTNIEMLGDDDIPFNEFGDDDDDDDF
jgi:hypothetical protein